MKKKLLSMLLVGAMAVGLLTGCGQNAADNSTPQTDNQGGQAQQPEVDAPIAEGEKVTLRLIIKDVSPEDPNYAEWQNQFNAGLEEAGIPAQIELVSIQSGTYSEQLALELNRGNIPDIIYFQGGDEDFALNQQILADLTPYIANTTYIKEVINKRPYMQTRLSNYPYLMYLMVMSTKVPVIRTDIFDQCPSKDAFLADPSVENYHQLMVEAKEAGGFRAAWTTTGDLAEVNNVFDQAFGLTTTWVKEGDSYVYGRVSEGSLEELKFYAQLYKEGLLDNEYLTDNWESKENKFFGDGVAIVSGTQGDVVDSYNTQMINAQGEAAVLTVLPPASGISQGYTPIDVSKESRGFAISALCEYKDLAMQVLDWAASPEGRILDLLGLEGVHYEYNADGKIERVENWYSMVVGFTDNLDESLLAVPYMSESGQKSLDMFIEYSSNDNTVVIPSEYATVWDAATNVYKEFAADFVQGKKTEADWDAFVEEWNTVGGAQVTEYINTVLN